MIAAILLAASLSDLWNRIARDTNSHAAAARGARQFTKGEYSKAIDSFRRAFDLAATPDAAFNLGTAQIAAGQREQGSATIQKALADPKLREPALYNRGNSALAAKAYDYAIRDYSAALKLDPKDLAAKRNLEIAWTRREEERKQQERQKQQQQGGKGGGEQKPGEQGANGQKNEAQRAGAGQQKKPGDANAEALLRSVQQQEQEELARMRRPRGERVRVGW